MPEQRGPHPSELGPSEADAEREEALNQALYELTQLKGEKEDALEPFLGVELPAHLQKESWRMALALRQRGLDEEGIHLWQDHERKLLQQRYGHRLTGLLNHDAMVDTLEHGIREGITERRESLRRVARISMDLNGLKAVNDICESHEQGNAYLRAVANVLERSALTRALRDGTHEEFSGRSFSVTTCAEGGDEFGLIFIGKDALKPNDLARFVELYKKEIASIDLPSHGVTMDDAIAKRRGRAPWKEIPSDFHYRASAAVGAATLEEALMRSLHTDITEDQVNPRTDTFPQAMNKIRRAFFDIADERMWKDKSQMKETWSKSMDPHERALSIIDQSVGRSSG